MLAGAIGGFSCGFMAMLQRGGGFLATDPWQLWFTVYSLGALASLAMPPMAWWYLLPRARWWGPAAMLVALTLYVSLFLFE